MLGVKRKLEADGCAQPVTKYAKCGEQRVGKVELNKELGFTAEDGLWYILRYTIVTATGAYKCIGCSKHFAVMDYFHHMFMAPWCAFESNAMMYHGVVNEINCMRAFAQITGNTVNESPFRCDEHIWWLGATPDGLVTYDHLEPETGPAVCECKSPYFRPYDHPNFEHIVQIFIQMRVYNVKKCYYICWFRGRCTRIWRIRWSNAFWSWLYIKMAIFWKCMINNVELNANLYPKIAHACQDYVNNGWVCTKDICDTYHITEDDLPPKVTTDIIHYDPFDGQTQCVSAEERAESERIFQEHMSKKNK